MDLLKKMDSRGSVINFHGKSVCHKRLIENFCHNYNKVFVIVSKHHVRDYENHENVHVMSKDDFIKNTSLKFSKRSLIFVIDYSTYHRENDSTAVIRKVKSTKCDSYFLLETDVLRSPIRSFNIGLIAEKFKDVSGHAYFLNRVLKGCKIRERNLLFSGSKKTIRDYHKHFEDISLIPELENKYLLTRDGVKCYKTHRKIKTFLKRPRDVVRPSGVILRKHTNITL